MSESSIVFEERALLSNSSNTHKAYMGLIRLNKPMALNAIDLNMVQAIQERLNDWRNRDDIVFIFLDAEGDKAFCAGGDIKALANGRVNTEHGIENPSALAFFDQEYSLNYDIHTYPKPIICWGNGIVMGGGVGLMVGCSHRIATETTRLAMPEISLGLYPDVGSSWFLNKAPGKTGLFIGLTGAQLNAHDAIYAGIADRFIQHDNKAQVLNELLELNPKHISNGSISQILKSFERKSQASFPVSELKKHHDEIQACCDFDTVSDIYYAIIKATKNSQNFWFQRAGITLEKGCPSSAHIIVEQLSRAKHLSLEQVFIMERNMSARYASSADFYEGVRALIIDKDHSPQWTYQTIEAVNQDMIDSYF